ncbi:MAG TPA: glycoside hydrolase family 95 protein [Capsulimonadaceae bacterium]|jgi:alpha-L-fucosidase 2
MPTQTKISTQNDSAHFTLTYDKPAADWETEALPIGNGRLGAMIFGGVPCDRIQFNENTLWTGTEVCAQKSPDLGAYQAFGDIFVTFSDHVPTRYRRSLDITRSLADVEYVSGGVTFTREYFASAPGQVIACRYRASKRGSLTGTIQLTGAHGETTTFDSDELVLAGALPNGQQYEARLRVIASTGTLFKSSAGLTFEACDELVLLLAAGTDYALDYDKNWTGEHPHEAVAAALEDAWAMSFGELRAAHVADYRSLFDRVAIDLGTSPPEHSASPTDQRLREFADFDSDPELCALYFQFGRYLLISSSRSGNLPANLQGLWNDSNTPPWQSDYHSNINIQMNYWPAEVTNLSECHVPMLDLIRVQVPVFRKHTQVEAQFQKPGRDVRGWTLRTETSPRGGHTFVWNKPANAWYCQHFFEHYAFTGDKAYLADVAYPLLKETVEFWEDQLKPLPDGSLVAPDGWSPEHGPTEDGVSYDHQIIWDLLTNYIEACDTLEVYSDYRAVALSMRDRLIGPKIGKWGQLQEWLDDRDDPDDKHRHVSHLFAVYPGRQISPSLTPDLAAAARKSLEARGDGGTGWSRAWKTSFWARFGDGDHAYLLLRNLMTPVNAESVDYENRGGTYANLFDAHPPFQIDGNFGATAAIAEMLIQSQTGAINLLPALPSAWPTGSVRGLKARGGFTVDIAWQDGRVTHAAVHAKLDGPCRIASSIAIDIATNGVKVATQRDGNVTEWMAEAGGIYYVTPQK